MFIIFKGLSVLTYLVQVLHWHQNKLAPWLTPGLVSTDISELHEVTNQVDAPPFLFSLSLYCSSFLSFFTLPAIYFSLIFYFLEFICCSLLFIHIVLDQVETPDCAFVSVPWRLTKCLITNSQTMFSATPFWFERKKRQRITRLILIITLSYSATNAAQLCLTWHNKRV